jgi:hypothetical protein
MSDQRSPSEKPDQQPPAKRPAWIAGGVLILAGVVFLLTNVAGVSLQNWWALFILIPALGSLWTAYTMFKRSGGKFTAASRGPLVGGLVLLGVTAMFLFNLDWEKAWPVLLIVAGAAVLISVIRR